MTEHEKHMEVYSTAILGTLQIIANTLIAASDVKEWVSSEGLVNLKEALDKLQVEPDKITALRNRVIPTEEPEVADKYLKLYKDSEDMRRKCIHVVAIMRLGIDIEEEELAEGDLDLVVAWSVVKCASGRVLVTVDYRDDKCRLQTYQFPVAWLDLTKKKKNNLKNGKRGVSWYENT